MSDPIYGFAFPFRIDASGGVADQVGPDKLKENVIQILLTNIGERIMRRDYGGGLRQLVHDPNNDALASIVQHQIAKAIARLEPRVLVQELNIAQEGATLTVSVRYTIRRTRQSQSVSVPIGLGGI